jgi:hypothetical protein
MANNDDLPKRENKDQRKTDQAKDAKVERDSFSVPDRFADRRKDGQGSYDSNRD